MPLILCWIQQAIAIQLRCLYSRDGCYILTLFSRFRLSHLEYIIHSNSTNIFLSKILGSSGKPGRLRVPVLGSLHLSEIIRRVPQVKFYINFSFAQLSGHVQSCFLRKVKESTFAKRESRLQARF